jgi:plastocyanin
LLATRTLSLAQARTVSISSFSFRDSVTNSSTTIIHQGDTVQWNWTSGTHSTTSGACAGACTPDHKWDSGQKSSGSFSFTFNQVGNFPYYCSVHNAAMTGLVIVRPPAGPFVLHVAPSNFFLTPGTSLQFSASRVLFRGAAWPDSSGENISSKVQWSTSDATIATVDNKGLVTAQSNQGPVTITASRGPLSAAVQLTVSTTVTLNSITVTPANQHVLLGTGTVTYTATGNYSDGTTQDLTGTATWSSSVPGVATIVAGGVATPVSSGNTLISATSAGVTGSTGLVVFTLSSITVTPANLHKLLGSGTVTYTAIGNYTDGSTQDLTGSVTWMSSLSAVATMAGNVATPANAGTTLISATSGSITGSTNLQVIVLSSIAVTPANQAVLVTAGAIPYTATGTYSDTSTQNLTGVASWSASPPGVVTMSNNVATVVAVGSTTISAMNQSITGSTGLQVVPVLTVSPLTTTISMSKTQQFTANLPVSWSVDGIVGGNSTIGTISGTGLYTPTGASIGNHQIAASTTSPPAQTATASLQVVSGFGGVLTYHNDNARTGLNPQEVILTPANVNVSHFRLLFNIPVDGKVDAQPLYVPAMNIAGGVHNVLFVATEHDSVYAFDADTGTKYWQVSMLKAGETTSDNRGCGQVSPEIGVTATPVIDLTMGTNGVIYVVAMSKNGSTYFQRLHALDLSTGAEMFSGPKDIQATYPGTGAGSVSGTVIFDPKQYKDRTSLLLLNGKVYTAWASHCDINPYTAWIMVYDETTLAQTAVIDLVPNGSEGAMWNAGAGLAADSSGNIYPMTGNGTFDTTLTGGGFPNKADYGNAFVKLSTASGLTVTDYFTMSDTVSESNADTDLGSGGGIVLPDMTDSLSQTRHLFVGAGKDGRIYLLDRDNMGKFNSGNNNGNAYQALNNNPLPGGLWSMPAYFNGNVYFGPVGNALRAFQFSSALLGTGPVSQSPQSFTYPGVTPSVSSNGATNGIVWATENTGTAVLHAYDANNLGVEFYNSNQAAGNRDHFGSGNKFITPMIANGKVYVGTTNSVGVFGEF